MKDDSQPEIELDGFPIASAGESPSAREDFEVLLSRFSEELRQGLQPSVEDYARRYPKSADQIRELFPLVTTLEHWKAEKEIECLRRNLPHDFPIRRLGKYDLVREVARGGMGIVFEAVHVDTGRRVAVKLLPWRFAADLPRWKQHFRGQAETIAGLQHPGIVPVYSFGRAHGYLYYVMQLIEGMSLDQAIRQLRESGSVRLDQNRPASDEAAAGVESVGRMPDELTRHSWQAFARIGAQAARALDYAHRRGVIHDDVKPANLLLDAGGHVFVTDFGMSRRDTGDGKQTDAQHDSEDGEHPVGTLRYMPPERVAGRGSDARSDIYALGATLYELITQSPAFDSDDRPDLIQQVLHTEPARPRKQVRQIPRSLETIVLQAMAKEPAWRYPSAQAFAADLLRFANGQRIRARRPSLLRRLLRWQPRSGRVDD
jgi:eukaryotic-like serine/threonine-protein kinase